MVVGAVVSILALGAVVVGVQKTRLGKATRAVSDNPALASSAGIDVDPAVQLGASYAATFAPGEFYEPLAYEKHEIQTWTRWRIDADYALSLSVSHTLAADRAPVETAIRA